MKKFFTTLLMIFSIFFSCTTVSFASDASDLDRDVQILQKYIVQFGNKVYFNENKAMKDNQPEEILEAGLMINDLNHSMQHDKSAMYKLGLKVYGNWCGPLHSGPGAPIDILDEGCMNHDLCYDKNGYFNCQCDRNLIAYINANYSKMTGWAQKIAAKAVKTYFLAQTKVHCW